MTFLDLCAGIGGFSLGLERAGMTCAGQVEIDDYCNRILEKHWPHVPRWGDITTLAPSVLPAVDLICGGYPCQPFSLAGKRQGAGDDRHLWPCIRTIVAHVRPTWCLFENVAGHVSMGLDAVLSDLGRLGYASGPFVIPACAVGAVHRRDRVWIVAHAAGDKLQGRSEETAQVCQESRKKQLAGFLFSGSGASVSSARAYGNRHGISGNVDSARRNKALGNAVVPQVVEAIGSAIMAAHENKGVAP